MGRSQADDTAPSANLMFLTPPCTPPYRGCMSVHMRCTWGASIFAPDLCEVADTKNPVLCYSLPKRSALSAYDGGIDHHVFVVVIAGQQR
jgi:hypothetical protein